MDSFLQLLFPTSCLVCKMLGPTLCQSCEFKIIKNTRSFVLEGVEVHSAAFYGDELARIILLAKEKNILAARNFLADLIVHSLMEATRGLHGSLTFLLVPIPSRSTANRKRGFRHSNLLALRVSSLLERNYERRVKVRELLQVNRKTADQSRLNRSQRAENLSGAFSIRESRPSNGTGAVGKSGELVFLMDDLVTTGVSMREGLRALKEAGISPFGALSAGVSPRVFS